MEPLVRLVCAKASTSRHQPHGTNHPQSTRWGQINRGNHFRDAVRARGGIPRIVATGMWGRDEQETLRKLKEWNQPIHRVRGRIEKIFGTWKRSYGLRRMRWRGLAKAAVQVHLTAIAYNLKRTMNILAAQA
uniref:transposase n=1 Tax=Sphingomonas populi TaxID=2484750 RepID=UPI001E33209D|nr:transposase [Sphingomonas populi]